MKEDIEFLENEDILMAIAPSEFEQWDVFLINKGSFTIKNVLVASFGYGFSDKGEKISTSSLRHFFDEVQGISVQTIEKIDPTVFSLNNEYWVSYWIEGKLFDRRFLFVPDSINTSNCIYVSILEREGILHA